MKKFHAFYILLLTSILLNANSLQINAPDVPYTIGYSEPCSLSETHEVVKTLVEEGNPKDPIEIEKSRNVFLINELNTSNQAQSYPWLSNDALRVYYTHDKEIYTASRSSINSKFSKGKSVMPDFNETVISGWLTTNELSIYIASQSSKLYHATRPSTDENFGSFAEVKLRNAPRGSLFDASFTPDMEELLMYNSDRQEHIVRFIKTGDNEYTYSEEVDLLSKQIPTGGQLSRDGLHFYVPLKGLSDDEHRSIYILTRTSMHGNFITIEHVKTAQELNFSTYQPSVNADESQMIFVCGTGDLWENNDLCEVTLVKEILANEVVEVKIDTTIDDKTYTIEYRGDNNSGLRPETFLSVNQQVMLFDYTGNREPPVGFTRLDNASTVKINDHQQRDIAVQVAMHIAPNPFNECTQIEILTPDVGYMVVQVISMDGQLVTSLFDGQCEKGINIIKWIKNGLSNGVYTVKTVIGKTVITKRVIICGGTD